MKAIPQILVAASVFAVNSAAHFLNNQPTAFWIMGTRNLAILTMAFAKVFEKPLRIPNILDFIKAFPALRATALTGCVNNEKAAAPAEKAVHIIVSIPKVINALGILKYPDGSEFEIILFSQYTKALLCAALVVVQLNPASSAFTNLPTTGL